MFLKIIVDLEKQSQTQDRFIKHFFFTINSQIRFVSMGHILFLIRRHDLIL